MKPTNGSSSQGYGGANYSSSSLAHPVGSVVTPSNLESPTPNMIPFSDVTPVSNLTEIPTLVPNTRFTVFRLNRTALLVTALVISFIFLIGISSFAYDNLTSKQSHTSSGSNSPTSRYSVGDLPLQKLNSSTTQIKLGSADELAINGQLIVNDTLILSPTTTPSTPIIGQLYYDQTTNQPYFYNGSKFISLQPTTATSSVSPYTTASTTTTTTSTVASLGGATGLITLGQGLSMTANQLDVATNLLNSLNATSITTGTLSSTRLSSNVTVQGNSFNGANQLVQLTSGGLLPILDGSNLTNLNIANLNATSITSGTLADARLTTNVTLQGNTFNGASQLVQLTAGGLLPVLNGSNLTNISASSLSGSIADASLSVNVTLQGNSFNGVSQLVKTTAGGILPAISGSNLTSLNGSNISSGTVADTRLSANVTLLNGTQTFTGADTFSNASNSFTGSGSGLSSLNGTNISSGTVADARLTTNVTLQGNTFNGASQLVQLTAGGLLPVLSGTNLTSLNGTNISSGTVADARLSVNVALLNGTGPQTFTGNNTFNGTLSSPTFNSTVATGTAPFTVASTTKVTNLNADLLDGLDSTAFGDATAANQTTILNRIGTNVDAAGTTTLFARLNNIDTGSLGTKADAASTVGTVFARFAQLFTYIGTPTDAASSSGSLFAQVRDIKANEGCPTCNLTLRQTITSSGTVTIPAGIQWAWAVVVGGGGGGGGGGSGGGGGGGVTSGWVKVSTSTLAVIGAGGTSNSSGSITLFGGLIGGAGGSNGSGSYGGGGGGGSGQSGCCGTPGFTGSSNYLNAPGGSGGGASAAGGVGAGGGGGGGGGFNGGPGFAGGAGGTGLSGGGGGGTYSTSLPAGAGGNGTFTGGGGGAEGNSGSGLAGIGGTGLSGGGGSVFGAGTTSGGGGGAGMIATGSNGSSATGGNGGSCGGGGGSGFTTGGSGGNGCILIYY